MWRTKKIQEGEKRERKIILWQDDPCTTADLKVVKIKLKLISIFVRYLTSSFKKENLNKNIFFLFYIRVDNLNYNS